MWVGILFKYLHFPNNNNINLKMVSKEDYQETYFK